MSLTAKFWKGALAIAIGFWSLTTLYAWGYNGGYSLSVFAQSIAAASALLLSASLSLGTLGYYFDVLDTWVGYRKYFGLLGYYLALFYSILLLFLKPDRYFYGFFENLFTPDFVFGLLAMAILTGMALISNNRAMMLIGPKLWRQLLGLGFVAYASLVIRAVFLEWDLWMGWLTAPSGLPPARLVISILAIAILTARASIPFHRSFSSRTKPPVAAEGPLSAAPGH